MLRRRRAAMPSSSVPGRAWRRPQGRLAAILGILVLVVACCSLLLVAEVEADAFAGLGAAALRRRSARAASPRGRAVQRQATDSVTEKRKPPSEWRLSVGHAIDVLRSDVVHFFSTEREQHHTPDFSIYDENLEVVDARLPSFQLHGITSYQRVLASLQWSVSAACERSHMEITATSLPVNNVVYMRWRLQLWPKDVLARAKGLLFSPLGGGSPLDDYAGLVGTPYVVEGYSNYEFHPWTGAIVKHTIDITNPPMYIVDVLRQYAQGPTWISPGMGVPNAILGRTGLGALGFRAASPSSPPASPPLAGAHGAAGLRAAGGRGASPRSRRPSPAKAGLAARKGAALAAPAAPTARRAGSWRPFGFFPPGCEDDFECNDGKANFPLQCCELPVLGKFCCEPDDYRPVERAVPAYVPLPVPVEEPFPPR